MLLLELPDISMKIAVIGAGIAGITFARQLAENANVTVQVETAYYKLNFQLLSPESSEFKLLSLQEI